MAITGVCLVLFVTFHVLMNSVAILWPTAYNQVCEFLGANWYALIASVGLAALFILHIIYALWLTLQNRKARGNDSYAVTSRPPQVEWASKNMLVLGIVVLAFLAVHLIQFWAKMQWQELREAELSALPQLDGVPVMPAQGTLFLQLAFSEVWTPIVYLIGFVALWFHMNHGFWSMFQTTGWNGQKWLSRLKKISLWWTSVVIGLFVIQVAIFTINAHNKYYTECPELQQQYAETYGDVAKEHANEFQQKYIQHVAKLTEAEQSEQGLSSIQKNQLDKEFFEQNAPKFLEYAVAIAQVYEKNCPKAIPPTEEFTELGQMLQFAYSRCMQLQVKLPESVTNFFNKQN